MSASEVVYDPGRKNTSFDVYFKNLDLAEVARAQKMKAVTVTGKVDGHLPVSLNADGLSIDNGTFSSVVPGGTIQYKSAVNGGSTVSGSLTGIVLKALEDFQYDLLSGTAQYTKEGELALNVHLEGVSPALETERPVHLNVNMEQNVLSLLKSLRYSKVVTEELDQRIQQQYKEN